MSRDFQSLFSTINPMSLYDKEAKNNIALGCDFVEVSITKFENVGARHRGINFFLFILLLLLLLIYIFILLFAHDRCVHKQKDFT